MPAHPPTQHKTRKLKIVVIGDLVLDVIAQLSGQITDIRRGTDTMTQIEAHPGGAAANTAIWLSRLGAEVRFISRVGNDLLGNSLLKNLEAEGVKTYVARDPHQPTGALVSLVELRGERSMLIGPAAHCFLNAADVPEKIFSGSQLVFVSGYLFFRDRPRQAALRAIECAQRARALIAIDPASIGLMKDFGTDHFLKLINDIDIVLPNSEEAELLIKNQNTVPYRFQDAAQLAKKLLERFSIVGLKLGAKGSLCGIKTNEKLQKINSQLTSKIAYVPAKNISSLVDSTGCGDAWNAAFLYHLLKGATLKKTASEANALAAGVLRHLGATSPRRA